MFELLISCVKSVLNPCLNKNVNILIKITFIVYLYYARSVRVFLTNNRNYGNGKRYNAFRIIRILCKLKKKLLEVVKSVTFLPIHFWRLFNVSPEILKCACHRISTLLGSTVPYIFITVSASSDYVSSLGTLTICIDCKHACIYCYLYYNSWRVWC